MTLHFNTTQHLAKKGKLLSHYLPGRHYIGAPSTAKLQEDVQGPEAHPNEEEAQQNDVTGAAGVLLPVPGQTNGPKQGIREEQENGHGILGSEEM